jgi:DNA-binding NarL/FixJ family response regulator
VNTRTLPIGLLDDHAVVRAGYRRLLELEDMEVVAEFADADSAYAELSATRLVRSTF